MEKKYKFFVLIFVFISVLFFNMSGVSAKPPGGVVGKGTNTGGSQLGGTNQKENEANKGTSDSIYQAPSHNQNSGSNSSNGAGNTSKTEDIYNPPANVDPSGSQSGYNSSAANNSNGANSNESESTDPQLEGVQKWGEKNKNGGNDDSQFTGAGNCAFIGEDTRSFLNMVFVGISVAGIIIVIVLTILDLIKVITGGDEKPFSNFLKGLRTRIICLVILLLLPTIISFVLSIVNKGAAIAGYNSDNPFCGITDNVN